MNIFLIECEHGLDVEDLHLLKREEQHDLPIYGHPLRKARELVFRVDHGCHAHPDVPQVEIIQAFHKANRLSFARCSQACTCSNSWIHLQIPIGAQNY